MKRNNAGKQEALPRVKHKPCLQTLISTWIGDLFPLLLPSIGDQVGKCCVGFVQTTTAESQLVRVTVYQFQKMSFCCISLISSSYMFFSFGEHVPPMLVETLIKLSIHTQIKKKKVSGREGMCWQQQSIREGMRKKPKIYCIHV